ncbi:helix-turn-helix transcriptional regulator [Bradyrhizobium sp. IC4060]|nr:helix-turn-helix transcriptional regulator [Bradyrhizobium sp. IC4060]MCA1484127.1 helix-turn-helix transcriptional regulator [Bradyrhizobium sp. IC4061]
MGLKDIRKTLRITQAEMAEAVGISQDGVSRIEIRADLRLSTIRSYIEAMGRLPNAHCATPHGRGRPFGIH